MDTAHEYLLAAGLVVILETPWGDKTHATICPLNPYWSVEEALQMLSDPVVWAYLKGAAYEARTQHMAAEPVPLNTPEARREVWRLGRTELRNGTRVLVPMYELEPPHALES